MQAFVAYATKVCLESARLPQSLSAVYIHLVFSTKDRRPLLHDKTTRDALHSYLGGVSKQLARPSPSVAWKTTCICPRASDEPLLRPNG